MDAVILAAGMGKRLLPYTQHSPKSLIEVGGMTILERQIFHLRRLKVDKIHIVLGHGADLVKSAIRTAPDIHYILNPQFGTTNVIMSLMLALPYVNTSFFCFCGDCVFEGGILDQLAACRDPLALVIICKNEYDDEAMKVSLRCDKIIRVGKKLASNETNGEFIGLAVINHEVVQVFKQQVIRKIASDGKNCFFGDAVDSMIQNLGTEVRAIDVTGARCCEVDYEEDLFKARQLFDGIA